MLPTYQNGKDAGCYSVRETRSKSSGVQLRPPAYLQHYSLGPEDETKPNKANKKKRDDQQETWKVHELDSDVVELQGDSIDNINYALKLGFPQDFASFVCRLDPIEVQVRLVTSLPVSLWMRILNPLAKLIKVNPPSAAGKRKRK